MKQHGLTLIIPVIPDKQELLETYFKDYEAGILEDFSKSMLIHSANFTILPPVQNQRLACRLLFTCNYDGDLMTLLRNSGKIPHAQRINEIFKFCENYTDGMIFNSFQFREYAKPYLIHCNIFVFAFKETPLADILSSNNLRLQLDLMLDRIDPYHFPKFLRSIKHPKKPEPKTKGIFEKLFLKFSQYAAGISEGVNDPTERTSSDRYVLDTEDMGRQNRLTVVVPIKQHWSYIHHILLWVTLLLTAKNPRNGQMGRISNVTTVHFARWAFIDKNRNLLFEANFDGSFESYIDDFVDRISLDLNCLFGHCMGFPRNGTKDLEAFKSYIRRNQIRGQLSYQAYPGLSIANILTNLSLTGVGQYNRNQSLQRYICGSYQS